MSVCEFLDKYKYGIVVALCIISLLFIMFGHRYRDKVQNVLKNEIVKFPESSIDYWSISHFLLFGIFGFLVPEHPLSFFALGVGFEMFEDYLSSDSNTKLANCSDNNTIICDLDGSCIKNKKKKKGKWCNGIQDGYWYMNPTDPWVNLTGYIIGSAIRTTL